MSSSKIVIAGTGRAGTTLLVQILTELGLDTGFKSGASVDPRSHAGLEWQITDPNAPRIVKDPALSTSLGPLLQEGKVSVEHIIIPIRDFDVAVASRVRASAYGLRPLARGGLFKAWIPSRQNVGLARVIYDLLFTIASHDIPHTVLLFPRFARDWEYTYRKLGFLIPDMSPEQFQAAFSRCVKPDLIKEKALSSSERVKSAMGTPISVLGKFAGHVKYLVKSKVPARS